MKVLMMVHGFAPECSGGTESYVLRLCKELLKRGHEVEVVCGSHEGAPPGATEPVVDVFTHDRLRVHRIHRTGLYVDNWEKGLAPEVLPVLDRVIERFRPDIAHVHHWIRLTRNLIEHCHDRGVPAVCTLHDLSASCGAAFRVHDGRFFEPTPEAPACGGCPPLGEYMDEEESRREWELARADFANELSLARRLIAPSNAHKRLILMEHPALAGRFRVVPHGNIARFKRRPFRRPAEEGGFPDGPLVIGHWGHLSRAKGIDVLVDAVAGLEDPATVRLELFGEMVYPREKEDIERRARDLPVTWRGAFQPRDLRRVPMDVAVIPTRCSESWSFVLDEAFQLGLPAIVSDRGALPERIAGAGEVFEAGSPDDLRRVIAGVLDDPGRLRAWGRNVPELPSMRDHALAMERVYHEVVTSRAPLPRTPLDRRTARLGRKVLQLEQRNRTHEDDLARIRNLEADVRRAQATMEEMAHHHRGKDAEMARLSREAEQARAEAASMRRMGDALAAQKERLRTILAQGRDLREQFLSAQHELRATLEDADARHHGEALDKLTRLLDEEERDRAEAARRRRTGAGGTAGDDAPSAPDVEISLLLEVAMAGQERLQELLRRRTAMLTEMAAALDDVLHHVEAVERRRRSIEAPRRSVPRHDANGRRGRMKVLFVVHQFLPRHVAGTEVYTFRLAKELQRRNDVVVLTAESDHSRPRYEESRRVYDGIPVHQVIHNYRWDHFRETYDCPEADAIFRRVLREEQPDVVHVQHLHHFSANFVTIARSKGIPVVFTLHDYWLICARDGTMRRADGEICELAVPERCADCIAHHDLSDLPAPPIPRGLKPGADALVPTTVVRAMRRLQHDLGPGARAHVEASAGRQEYLRKVLADVDLFISPSRFLRDRFVASELVPPDRILVSDNGIDAGGFRRSPPRALPPEGRLRVGYVGTIAEHKGLHILVEAMNRIEDDRVHCHVWGEPKAFVEYTARLEESIRNPRTLLMGPFPNDRVSEVLENLDVLVIPSLWYENSPLTVHEAALAGVPVIASRIGGLAEYVKEGVTGLLFEPDDPDDLARTILACLETPGPLGGFDPSALEIKTIAEDARDMEKRYRELLRPMAAL